LRIPIPERDAKFSSALIKRVSEGILTKRLKGKRLPREEGTGCAVKAQPIRAVGPQCTDRSTWGDWNTSSSPHFIGYGRKVITGVVLKDLMSLSQKTDMKSGIGETGSVVPRNP